ncbi:10 kDa chaperonin [Geobacillus sp. BCO2]|nr:10 kDa chaperonin [Geobacillus sp. BCO2]
MSLKSWKQKKKRLAASCCRIRRKEKPQEGRVVAVGAGRVLDNGQRIAPEVEVGDRIIFSKYAGTEVKYDGKEYLILRESDILAVVR